MYVRKYNLQLNLDLFEAIAAWIDILGQWRYVVWLESNYHMIVVSNTEQKVVEFLNQRFVLLHKPYCSHV